MVLLELPLGFFPESVVSGCGGGGWIRISLKQGTRARRPGLSLQEPSNFGKHQAQRPCLRKNPYGTPYQDPPSTLQ